MIPQFLNRMKFRAKIIWAITAIICLFGLVVGISVARLTREQLVGLTREKGAAVVQSLATRLAEPVLTLDFLRMKNLVDEQAYSSSEFLYAFIIDTRGEVLAHSFRGGFPVALRQANSVADGGPVSVQFYRDERGASFYDFAAPIIVAGDRFATARLGLSRKPMEAALTRAMGIIFGLTAGMALLSIWIGGRFASAVTSRIDRLRASAEEMVKGNLDIHTGVSACNNCWEILECGLKDCPAYENTRYRCWYLAGTLCPELDGQPKREGQKEGCRQCDVFRMNSGDEIQALGEAFDVMAHSLKAHIQELKDYEQRLLQAQKMESLGKLAGGVAHEVNTPLGIILGYTQLLLEDFPAESRVADDLRIIEKHTKICRKIVADLLGFSRATGSSMSPMDLNDSLEEVAGLVEHTFYLDNVSIVRDYDPDMPQIVGDRGKLKQVWINLLDNAFDAVGSEGAVMLRTRWDVASGTARVFVADTGPGIDSRNLRRLFDPFFTTKPVGKGTGLGLSVSYGIIKDHDGSISAQSPVPDHLRPGSHRGDNPGAVFIVELPRRRASDNLDEASDTRTGHADRPTGR